ncbi:pilus assembly protein TadG-related protein [Bradyrhizobium sp. CCBAU 51753]|uniref:pilus assembly protein TadG-related protein n=1 Tax=Bradyrhizobium sp. CCBAU 51753 TaxID=1325100 RepID=UPI00188B515E|nr:pilus assembly protein TadG-related protein [Bradyrhizobium sp. CCBAU 51753]
MIALVPLVGALAIGGEAGVWYVTKQRVQGAADAAAYAGALKVACDNAPQPGVTCNNSQPYDYRGKQAAAQNSFCNTGDTSYPGSKCSTSLPSGISQSVQVASLTTWNGVSGQYVQATITQTQPAYIAKVLGLTTVSVAATAVAGISGLSKPPCVLSLKDPITFQGSPTLTSPTCGVASNSAADNAIGFKGNSGISVDAPSYTVGGCSQTGGSQCTNVKTYQQSVPDPLSGLSAAIGALKVPNDFPSKSCSGSTIISYEAGACVNTNGNPSLPSTALNGTYYITGNLKINGSPTITGTATLIFFGGGSLTITGNPTIQLTAVKSPAGPSALSASAKALMKDLLIYDDEASSLVKVTGSSTSYFNGTVYIPNSPVTYSGNSSGAPSTGCYQVIAYSVQFVGNTRLDNTGCISDGAAKPNVQTVRLVQ